MFEFDGGGHFRGNKHLITKINFSVVFDLGWENTQENRNAAFLCPHVTQQGQMHVKKHDSAIALF